MCLKCFASLPPVPASEVGTVLPSVQMRLLAQGRRAGSQATPEMGSKVEILSSTI